jgi:bifunctional non-homologous end joining protein LigD
VRLISRHGNRFASFDPLCQSMAFFLSVKSAVMDGEIACLDQNGCSQFNNLLFRRGEPTFCAFDLLALNGRDLRDLPLVERKRRLRDILPHCPQLLFVDYIEGLGEELFELVCQRDLEGIVAKHRESRYSIAEENPPWIKIRNRGYSQMVGRDELFERRYEAKGAPEIGWNVCATAAGNAA